MSPMTMYRSTDGLMNDSHVMLLGSRPAGGFGLVFPEQSAITINGRKSSELKPWQGGTQLAADHPDS